jgi:hypothetical protein
MGAVLDRFTAFPRGRRGKWAVLALRLVLLPIAAPLAGKLMSGTLVRGGG